MGSAIAPGFIPSREDSQVSSSGPCPVYRSSGSLDDGLWTALPNGAPRDMAKIFQARVCNGNRFRESRIQGMWPSPCPHTLMRLPYGQASVPVEAFNYEEDVDGTDHSKYLWGQCGLCPRGAPDGCLRQVPLVRCHPGVEGGGLVQGCRPYLPDRTRGYRSQCPRRCDHRPRKGDCRSWLCSGLFTAKMTMRLFRHPDGEQTESLRLHLLPRRMQGSLPTPVYYGRLPFLLII